MRTLKPISIAVAMLVLPSACEAPAEELIDPTPEMDPAGDLPDAGVEDEPLVPGDDDESQTCTMERERHGVVSAVVGGASDQHRNQFTVRVTNTFDTVADVTVSVGVWSEAQDVATQLAPVRLGPQESAEVPVDLRAAGALTTPLAAPGHVYLTVTSDFSDGTRQARQIPHLFFHPEAEDLVVYGRQQRLAMPFGGQLGDSVATTGAEQRHSVDQESEALEGRDQPAFDAVRITHTPSTDHAPLGPADERATANGDAAWSLVEVEFCFDLRTWYKDGADGLEDSWTDTSFRSRPAIGNRINIDGPGLDRNVYLSESGCYYAGYITPGDYEIKLRSRGKVNGWQIRARDLSGDYDNTTVYPSVDSDGTYTMTIGYSDVRNVYLAMAKAVKKHGGKGSNKGTMYATVGNCSQTGFDAPSTVRICGPNDVLDVEGGHINKKFTIAHEVGHLLHYRNNGNRNFPGSYTYDPPNENRCDPKPGDLNLTHYGDGANAHFTTSTEYQSAAAKEGFASFYAADAFNSHSDGANCWINIGRWGTFPCRDGDDAAHPKKLMETDCSPFPGGLGNETDWARAFWQLHTHTSDDADNLNDIFDWMDASRDDMSSQNAYGVMVQEAGAFGFRSEWEEVGEANGIDW